MKLKEIYKADYILAINYDDIKVLKDRYNGGLVGNIQINIDYISNILVSVFVEKLCRNKLKVNFFKDSIKHEIKESINSIEIPEGARHIHISKLKIKEYETTEKTIIH